MTHQLTQEQRKETLRIPHVPHATRRGCTDAKFNTDMLTDHSGKKKILLVSMNL